MYTPYNRHIAAAISHAWRVREKYDLLSSLQRQKPQRADYCTWPTNYCNRQSIRVFIVLHLHAPNTNATTVIISPPAVSGMHFECTEHHPNENGYATHKLSPEARSDLPSRTRNLLGKPLRRICTRLILQLKAILNSRHSKLTRKQVKDTKRNDI